MKILLSAFACDPYQGSEPAVGWAWARELARAGHEICVLTKDHHRAAIRAALAKEHIPNLRFEFIHVPEFLHKIPGLGMYPYYCVWQLKAYLIARASASMRSSDCVHHVTYGNFRTPFFLALLGIPAIFGPVGGGEATPLALFAGLSFVARINESLRHAINFLSRLNPLTWLAWRNSHLILLTTKDTLRNVPRRFRNKCRFLPAITTPETPEAGRRHTAKESGQCRALFVGRLIEWKGAHLAIRALSIARKTCPGISLSMRGDGKRETALRELVRQEGLDSAVNWIPRFSGRQQVLDVYREHDVLVFPSFHDTGGLVVLEAMSRGVPVICLDLGGPGTLVDETCGARVSTCNRPEPEIVRAIADEMIRFANMPAGEIDTVRQQAIKRASNFTVDAVVARAYEWFEERFSCEKRMGTRTTLNGGNTEQPLTAGRGSEEAR